MPNASVLIGKRKRHQLLNSQNANKRLNDLKNRDINYNYNNNNNNNKLCDVINITPTPIQIPPATHLLQKTAIFSNIPDIQFTSNNFPELWLNIFSHLKISHLFELSVKNKLLTNQQQQHYEEVEDEEDEEEENVEEENVEEKDLIHYNYKKAVAERRNRICEECFKYICSGDGAKAVLNIYLASEHSKLYLCLTCRQKYYTEPQQPQHDDDNNNSMEDNEFELKYNVHENFIDKSTAENDFLLSYKDLENIHCITVRNPHGRSLPFMRLYRYTDIMTAVKQKYGGSVGFLAQLEKREIRKTQEDSFELEEQKNRKILLEKKLLLYGLSIPYGMKAVARYIRQGFGDLQKIVNATRELDWFNRCTNYDFCLAQYLSVECDSDYPKNKYFRQVDSIKATELAKKKALEQWLTERFKQHKYQPVEFDELDNDRPPKFLWDNIQSLWKPAMIKHAITLLPPDVFNTLKNGIKKKHRSSELAISIIKYHLNHHRIPPTRPLGPTSDQVNTFGKVLRIYFTMSIYEDIAKSL
ncbi:unnamed protein product [Cunninghamella echinulata]